MNISEFCEKAHGNAVNKGFWDNEAIVISKAAQYKLDFDGIQKAYISQKLMLIVSELGEALEALRKDNAENFEEEIADVWIRLADFCGGYGIEIESAIHKKMLINENRPRKHGKNF